MKILHVYDVRRLTYRLPITRGEYAFQYTLDAHKSACDQGFVHVAHDRPHIAFRASSGISDSCKDRHTLPYQRKHGGKSYHGSSRLLCYLLGAPLTPHKAFKAKQMRIRNLSGIAAIKRSVFRQKACLS